MRVSKIVCVLGLVFFVSQFASADKSHVKAANHEHKHGPDCGHKAVIHGKHMDYIHDGHYHAEHGDHYDEHGTVLTSTTKSDRNVAGDSSHRIHKNHKHTHGEKCGHEAVKHDDHTDYIHDGHYHALHEDHVDDHGSVTDK